MSNPKHKTPPFAREMNFQYGVLERIAPFRWRLVIPWPQSTSKLDVFELTPVANQPQG